MTAASSGFRLGYGNGQYDAIISQFGGTLNITDSVAIIGLNSAAAALGTGVYNMYGGTLNSGGFQIGAYRYPTGNAINTSSSGRFNQIGGAVNLTGNLKLGFPATGTSGGVYNTSNAYWNLKGGLLNVGLGTISRDTTATPGTRLFNFTGGTLKARTIDASVGDLTQSATDNPSLLDVTGNNTTINGNYSLLGNATYAATVNVGSLQTLTMGVNKVLTIGSKGVLKGAGTVVTSGTGQVSVLGGGKVAPNVIGTTIVVLATTETLTTATFAAGAILDFKFGGTSDLITVTTVLTLPDTGTITFNVIDNANAGGGGSLRNGTFPILTYGSLVGGNSTFNATFAIGSTPAGWGTDTKSYTFSNNPGTRTISLTIASLAVSSSSRRNLNARTGSRSITNSNNQGL
ncbi:MAG: hypothetical protein WCJ35_28410 [Planctomycetota bacterium]